MEFILKGCAGAVLPPKSSALYARRIEFSIIRPAAGSSETAPGGTGRPIQRGSALGAHAARFYRIRAARDYSLEHFSEIFPVSLRRSVYSGSLRGRLHRCAMETCSARIDPHTVFALAPVANRLKNALSPSDARAEWGVV